MCRTCTLARVKRNQANKVAAQVDDSTATYQILEDGMSDLNVKLDATTRAALVKFIEAREGLFGALKLKGEVEKCTCYLCKLVMAVAEEQ